MTTPRRIFPLASIAFMICLLLAACGGTQANSTTGSSNSSMGTSSQGMNSQAMGASPTAAYPTPTMQATMPSDNNMNGGNGGNMNAFIHTAVVMLNGKNVHVLTTNKGFLLYYFLKDHMFTSTCTGACAQAWPPLLAPQGMMTVSSSVPLPKKLSIKRTANGNQIFYDGHALYTYTGDMQAGQFNGRGMDNAWYLAGVTL